MQIDHDLIFQAKEKLGDENASIIVEQLGIQNFDWKNMRCCCPFHQEDHASFIYNPKEYVFHCFSADTRVVTKQGVFRIKELVGKPVEIINGNGDWETVTFRSYGIQRLMELTLSRLDRIKTIFATPEHEWIVQRRIGKTQTQNLKPGDRLAVMWHKEHEEIIPSLDGLAHGFLFGDGTFNRTNKCDGVSWYNSFIWDEKKVPFCQSVFGPLRPAPKSEPNMLGWVSYGSKEAMKDVPDLSHSKEYLMGFLAGLFVADGNCTDETAIISSADIEKLSKVRDIATYLGIPTYPIGVSNRSKDGNSGCFAWHKDHTIYTLRFAKGKIPEAFFASKEKYMDQSSVHAEPHLAYKVQSVRMTDRCEEVFCCVTSTHSFVLEDFILTGNCFGSCGRNYDILDAYMYNGLSYAESCRKLFDAAGINFAFGELGVQTRRQYRYPHEVECTDKTAVYSYFGRRKISSRTLDYADVRQDQDGNAVFNYYDTNDVLTMVKYRPARKIKKGENKCWCQKDSDTTPLLFNMNRINATAPLLICEGEPDCLSAIEAGFTNAVSVPLGAGNFHWMEENWEWLEQFNEIIICGDNDDAGVKMVKECIYRLGSWRTKTVVIPPTFTTHNGKVIPIKDLNEVLYRFGKEKVMELILDAKDNPVPGVIDFSDIEDIDLDAMDGIPTGIPALDRYLMKLFYGTLNIVTGINGSGKSSFLNQILCQCLDRGENAYLFSGELPNFQAKNWLNFIFAGQRNVVQYTSRDAEPYYKVTPDAKRAISDYYRGRLFIRKDGESNAKSDILQQMEDCVRKHGCKLLVLDNLTAMNLEGNDDNKYAKQAELVTELIKFAVQYNVAIVLVVHPHKIDMMRRLSKMDVQGISAIIDLAHRIISLYRVQDKDKEGEPKLNGSGWRVPPEKADVIADILKDRLTGYESRSIKMFYDRPSRRFFTDEKELDHQYGWDKKKYTDPLPFPPEQLEEDPEEDEVFGGG